MILCEMRHTRPSEADCAIAQALAVVGDEWSLLVLRDVAGGLHRFDDLRAESGISRKVLAQRLAFLVEHDVLEKRLYSAHPPRFEYHFTAAGRGLVPVLVALQDWGTRFLLGDSALTATGRADSPEGRRLHRLVGRRIPALTLRDTAGRPRDPVDGAPWTVLYCYPGAYAATASYPPGWDEIPGAAGCTLEAIGFRERAGELEALGARIAGVSTQRPDELASFARKQRLPFALLSDEGLALAAALRLPTFRAGGAERLKRVTLLVDGEREIRGVLYPVAEPAAAADEALRLLDRELAATG